MHELEMILIASGIESAMYVASNLVKICTTYESRGIDVVPISELKKILHKAMHDSLKEDSLAQMMTKDLMRKGGK